MSVLDLADTVVPSCFDLLTISFKQNSTMKKTSSFIAFLLAVSFLSLFVAPSDARILGMGSMKKKKRNYSPSGSPPTGSPPSGSVPATCEQTCASIANKAFISGPECTFANCVGLFECQNLPNVAGFNTQTACSSYCVGYTNLQCPSGNTMFAGNPTSRCVAARCTPA
jgi:hypothetical protein